MGRAEESFPGFSFGWSLVWVSFARPAHLRQLQAWHVWCHVPILGARLQVSYSLQSPYGHFCFPGFFLLAYGVAKGNAGFEITGLGIVSPSCCLPRASRGRKASALQTCLRKQLPLDKGEFLPLFA